MSVRNEPPHAVDAERAVLGALLLNNELFEQAEGRLRDNFFYEQRHTLLYQVMRELHGKGYVDPTLLAKRLTDDGKLNDAGGAEYIAALAEIGAAPVNVPAYIDLVRDTALLRMMIRSLSDSVNEAFSPAGKPPQQVLDEAEARLAGVGDAFQREYGGIMEIGDLANNYFSEISKIVETKNYEALRGVATGYRKLDNMTNGLHGGDFIVLAGRPGSGKTAFGLNVVRHVSKTENVGVVFFSLEMSAKVLTMRLLAHAGVELQKMRSGVGLKGEQLRSLAASSSELEKQEIYIDESGTLNILEIRARCRRIKRKMEKKGVRLGLVVVDYLQMMDTAPGESGRNDTEAQKISYISRGLKSLAKELNTPVLALSQVNRNVEYRPEKELSMADLRGSGAIEQDADLILFLQPGKNNTGDEEHRMRIEVDLVVGKHRNGPTGTIPLHFDKAYSRFIEIVAEANVVGF